MRKTMRWTAILLAMLLALTCLGGCGKKEEPVEEEPIEPVSEPEPTPTVTPEPTPEPVKRYEELGFSFIQMDEVMYTTANLNVRNRPNTEGEKIGMFYKGAEVEVSGQCEETGWFRVMYDDKIGYVSNDYLE